MRLIIFGILLVSLAGCSWIPELFRESVVTDNCETVPKLNWQHVSTGVSASEQLELATKLTAAAQADAKASKDVNASGKVNISVTSKLAEVINSNVKKESKVSDQFWQQDLTFRQTLCFLDSFSQRKDLTAEQKQTAIDKILDLTSSRHDYVFQLEKKRVGSPQ